MALINWFDKLPNQNLSQLGGGASVRVVRGAAHYYLSCSNIISFYFLHLELFLSLLMLLVPPFVRCCIATNYGGGVVWLHKWMDGRS